MNRGGTRVNSGRKPVTDKKQGVTIYVKQSHIDRFNGKENLQEWIYKCIEKAINR